MRRIEVIYSCTHSCGRDLHLSDYRIHSDADLARMRKSELSPLRLYCCNCMQETAADRITVLEFDNLGVRELTAEMELEEFLSQ